MVQVDLITGFLGAGKTTFLRKYVHWLNARGQRVCILENDFGAVNVDVMLLQDLLGDNCDIETSSGAVRLTTQQKELSDIRLSGISNMPVASRTGTPKT